MRFEFKTNDTGPSFITQLTLACINRQKKKNDTRYNYFQNQNNFHGIDLENNN